MLDNIPGVPGVAKRPPCASSPNTATSEGARGRGQGEKGRLRERLLENADLARLSRTLATICRDAPVALIWTPVAPERPWRRPCPPARTGHEPGPRAALRSGGRQRPAPAPAARTAPASDGDVETPRNAAALPRALPIGCHGQTRRHARGRGLLPPPRTRRGCACPGRRPHRPRHQRGGAQRGAPIAAKAPRRSDDQGAGRAFARDRRRRL